VMARGHRQHPAGIISLDLDGTSPFGCVEPSKK
jgi:hypothetical protein